MKTCGIYSITHAETGKVYVGQSRNIEARWRQHAKGLEPFVIGRTIAKHGWAAFRAAVLEECGADQLNERERHWIAALGSLSPAGYNLTTGGCQGKTVTEDVRRRISEATRAGLTPEVLERRTASMRGIPKSAEWKAAMSARQKARYQDPVELEKLRQRALGMSAETRSKIAASRLGQRPSDETRCKLSESSRARNAAAAMHQHPHYMSAEARAKMSAAQAARAMSRDPKTGQFKT